MDEQNARTMLDNLMNLFVGVPACDPEGYYLDENDPAIRATRNADAMLGLDAEDFFGSDGSSLQLSNLFRTGGAVSPEVRKRKRKASPEVKKKQEKWIAEHQAAFAADPEAGVAQFCLRASSCQKL